MKNNTRQILLWIALVIAAPSLAQSDLDTLTINQSAPPIKVGAWLKGQPIDEFQKGMIYVMDFGFISCGPCRAAIPHMTELARKYEGRVQVISVFVYENSKTTPGKAYIQKVKNFIDRQGDKIGYVVAVDDEQQTMARTWYEPAARAKILGFPAVFVVDQTGKIIWIGAANQLDNVIEDIVQKRFDPNTGLSLERDYGTVFKRIYLSTNKKEFKTAVRLIDSLITRQPMNKSLYHWKFKTLLAQDMYVALDYGRQLLSDVCNADESILTHMADAVISKSYIKEYRECNELSDLVIYLTDRALVLSKSALVSSTLMSLQAKAYANKNMFLHAMEKQTLSLDYFDKEIQTDIESAKDQRKGKLDVLESYKQQASLHNDF